MKLIIGIILGIISVIFLIQNTEIVTIDFLFWSLTTSRALVIMIVLILGIFFGWIFGSVGRRKNTEQIKKST
jgi:uncharacterized integral membrane protein